MTAAVFFGLIIGCGNKYTDNDNDGFFNSDDCDDNNPNVNINGIEICNGIDDDCDGKIDILDPDLDTTDLLTLYNDSDGDGYGGGQSILLCALEAGYAEESNDCDDSNPNINPAVLETCNGIDDNCNDLIDDEDPDLSASSFAGYFIDADGDGFGGSNQPSTCDALSTAVTNSEDCDDTVAGINPSASEICDDIDMDCDGLDDIDDPDTDPSSILTLYKDSDGDGFGNSVLSLLSCNPVNGYTDNALDCDDANQDINPNATEVCDGVDNDCDNGSIETGLVSRWTNNIFSDESSNASAGSSSAPFILDLSDPTILNFCDGSYYVSITTTDELTVQGFGNAILTGNEAYNTIELSNAEDNVEIYVSDLEINDASNITSAFVVNGEDAQNTLLNIENTTFSNNSAYVGGAIAVADSEVIITNSIFNNNSALGAGAIYALNSNVSLDFVEFDGNLASSGAAIAATESVINIYNTHFTNNQADNGIIATVESNTTCYGSTSSDLGFHYNLGTKTGIFMDELSQFVSNDCDFGDAMTPEDNEGIDISTYSSDYFAGNDANFTCSNGCCGSSNQTAIGNPNSYTVPLSCPVHPDMIGMVITVQGTPTLDSFSLDLNGYFPCQSDTVTAAVFKENSQGTWDNIWEDSYSFSSTSASSATSGPVGTAFRDGERIALVFYGNLRLAYGFQSNASSQSYPGVGSWLGERIEGQYCTSNCSWASSDVEDLIITDNRLPSMQVSMTNLP